MRIFFRVLVAQERRVQQKEDTIDAKTAQIEKREEQIQQKVAEIDCVFPIPKAVADVWKRYGEVHNNACALCGLNRIFKVNF